MATQPREELYKISDDHTLINLKFQEAQEILSEVEGKFSKEQWDVLKEFQKFLKTRLLKHFKDEETSFFKLLLKLPKENIPPEVSKSMIKQLIADHRLIKLMILQLEKVMRKPSNVAKISLYTRSLIEFVRVHARKENEIVFFLCDSLDDARKCKAIVMAFGKLHPAA